MSRVINVSGAPDGVEIFTETKPGVVTFPGGVAGGGSTINPSTSIYDGTVTANTTAQALGDQSIVEVLVQCESGNALVGSETSQHMPLGPGASLTLEVSNLNLVYVKTASSTAVLNYIARS